MESLEVLRFRSLMASGQLTHPFLRSEYFQRDNEFEHDSRISEQDCVANFTDLASALATCCGVPDSDKTTTSRSNEIARDIGINTRHIIVILCDGMGNAILDQHVPETSFLRRNNQRDRLRAVWPSTTPAALTTLATAQWPGQHGVPGWDLREQPGCDFPGEASGGDVVQLRVLAPRIMNVRTDKPANYAALDDVFVATPWARSLPTSTTEQSEMKRRMMFINAYNGDDFPSWYQGKTDDATHASDFSSWQTGQTLSNKPATFNMFDVATIGETSFATLGQAEGSKAALKYFSDGIKSAIRSILEAEAKGHSSYTYLYTAHPDKHMHALGTDHQQVETLIRGIDKKIGEMYKKLNSSRSDLLRSLEVENMNEDALGSRIDFTIVVTADHGHVNVLPQDMVVLPDSIIECLEYANIGVHGKGRHGYLHCRSGLQSTLRERWRKFPELNDAFILLTIEEASESMLFGPDEPLLKVRPRLGDFVAISLTQKTLVTPNEWTKHKHHCQGAHGSLLEAEMKIPFILCKPSQELYNRRW